MDTKKSSPAPTRGPKAKPVSENGSKATMELLFVALVGVVVIAALLTSLTYDLHSALAPLCIIVPLLILTGVQFNRARKAVAMSEVRRDLLEALRGQRATATAVFRLMGWMLFLLLSIYLLGHYAGMFVFMLLLLRVVAKEKLLTSLLITFSVTFVIFLLFELLFNIELYRGVIPGLFTH